MKKLYIFYFIAFLTAIFISCSKYEENPKSGTNDDFSESDLFLLNIYSQKDFSRSIEEAMEIAEAVMIDFDSDVTTRAGASSRKISSMRVLCSDIKSVESNTRATDTESGSSALAYVINFETPDNQDAGFVIISADIRIKEELLAFAPFGGIPVEDDAVVDNDGLAFFLDNAEEYALWSIAQADQEMDSLKTVLIAQYAFTEDFPDGIDSVEIVDSEDETTEGTRSVFSKSLKVVISKTVTRDWYVYQFSDPLIPVEWDQDGPFYNSVRNKKGCNNVVTGCVAVAGIQLMAYWKYPTIYNGVTLNWDDLVKYTANTSWYQWKNDAYGSKWIGSMYNATPAIQKQCADLMKQVGESIGMDYHCGTKGCSFCGGGGSGAKTSSMINHLKAIGFKASTFLPVYSFALAVNSINNARPVIISGYSNKTTRKFLGITISTSYSGGHAWNIDGYKIRKQNVTQNTQIWSGNKLISNSTKYIVNTENLLHNNWGWGGRNNGYFLAGVFDANNKIQESNTRSGTANYYQYNISMWDNIYK